MPKRVFCGGCHRNVLPKKTLTYSALDIPGVARAGETIRVWTCPRCGTRLDGV